jgi:hypothetical protein
LLESDELEVTVAALTVCEPLEEFPVFVFAAAGGPFAPFNVSVSCCVIVLPVAAPDDAEVVCVLVLLVPEFAVAVVV